MATDLIVQFKIFHNNVISDRVAGLLNSRERNNLNDLNFFDVSGCEETPNGANMKNDRKYNRIVILF